MSDDANIVVENELLRRGFTSIPNYIFGLPISSNAKLIYMALLSYAWTNRACYPGLAKLCTDVSLSDKPVTKAIEELSNASLLEVKRRGQGKTNLYILKDFVFSQEGANGYGSRFGESPNQESENLRIKNRTTSGSRNGTSPSLKSEKRRIPNKRIEKDKEEEPQEETHAHKSERGVGVGSKFTLEDCQKYATYLHASGQGITNPGGYATTIFRSGEADALIEKFLNPPSSEELPDTSQCLDCHGTGFWYPKGISNGVKKCKHERLSDTLQSPSGNSPDQRMTEEQIAEQAALIADLLESGYTVEQAKAQFASGLHPDDWDAIREVATARLNDNRRANRSSSAQSHNHHNDLGSPRS
ncbi:MAG TPA: helix-turn-helix domain-containing protein [Pyrinomonadaceae bacterium]|nr:helix-turn-helix domain-containing protein [Pyrinomonadaceae bacterium]